MSSYQVPVSCSTNCLATLLAIAEHSPARAKQLCLPRSANTKQLRAVNLGLHIDTFSNREPGAMATFTPEEVALAQPDDPSTATIDAWYMDDSDKDQREPHRLEPNQPASPAKLAELGVLYWRLDADEYETDPKLAAIRKIRGYSYIEIISISKDTLPGYEEKIKTFYQEHIHTDEEIRYILDGSGYFDVRDFDDRWIRIHCKRGDLIILPEGIYHRFTLDDTNYTKAMRLFVGEPVWTPYNRPQDDHPSRAKYLDAFRASPVSA